MNRRCCFNVRILHYCKKVFGCAMFVPTSVRPLNRTKSSTYPRDVPLYVPKAFGVQIRRISDIASWRSIDAWYHTHRQAFKPKTKLYVNIYVIVQGFCTNPSYFTWDTFSLKSSPEYFTYSLQISSMSVRWNQEVALE